MRYNRIADIYLLIGFTLLPLAYLFKEPSSGGVLVATSLLFLGVGILFHLVALASLEKVRKVADFYLASSFILLVGSLLFKDTIIGLLLNLLTFAVFQVSLLFYIVAFAGWFSKRKQAEATVS